MDREPQDQLHQARDARVHDPQEHEAPASGAAVRRLRDRRQQLRHGAGVLQRHRPGREVSLLLLLVG